MELSDYIAEQIEKRPIEARVIRKVIRTLKAAGDPIVSTWDGEDREDVRTEKDILGVAFNLDEVSLITKSGSHVYFVMGQDWEILTDHSMDLEDALKPVWEWIEKNED